MIINENKIIEIKELYYNPNKTLIYEKETLCKLYFKDERILIKNKNYITLYNIHFSEFDNFINKFQENIIYDDYILLINKFVNDYSKNTPYNIFFNEN
tara:strand:+ start:59 stop:352 length:294 start_codon:yes stop_codon:yes gene_type:complete